MKKYNHMVVVAFEIVTEHEDPEEIPALATLAAMARRQANLLENIQDAREAFDFSDMYEVQE